MPFALDSFAERRPTLFHLTATCNVPRIVRTGRIEPASELLASAGRVELLGTRRPAAVRVRLGGDEIMIRDQSPLHPGNASLTGGWTFSRLVEELNRRVFFWPGRAPRPIESGVRHFQRYRSEDCSVFVLNTADLFSANCAREPQFCPYNSGSPRCTRGEGSPRGPYTFVPAHQFPRTVGGVIEVTYKSVVVLPDSTRIVPLSELLQELGV